MIGFITKVGSFGALARYLQAGTHGPSERRVLWTTARYVSNDLRKAAAEMNLTGRLTDTRSLGYHLTIGYDPTDRPTRAEMENAVQKTLSALRLENNMAITAAHGDAYFAHTHTMVARWDYWKARLVEASNSYYVVTRVMRELEKEMGMEPAPRPHWERYEGEEDEREREAGSPRRDAERFPAAARTEARSALRKATSWPHLRALLQKKGLRFQRGRDNLLIGKGEVAIRAGQIAGGTSLAKLEGRFGQTLREHQAEVAGRLVGAGERSPHKKQDETRTQTGGEPRPGKELDGEVRRAETILAGLAKALSRREEAYQLARRSALLEAEEADAAGLQQDLQQIETRGTALLEGLLQAGSPSSQKRFSEGAFAGSERANALRRNEQARKLWRAAASNVERQETTRSVVPEGVRDVLGKGLAGKNSAEEERQLLALLSEHRQAGEQAVELFGPDGASAGGQALRQREGGGPRSLSGTETPEKTPDKEAPMGATVPSAKSHPEKEEALPGGKSRQEGVEVTMGGAAATPPAEALLAKTRASIREARAEIERRLRGWQRQVQGGEGAAELERRLRRVLGQLADRDLEAATRFARRYVLRPGVAPVGQGGADRPAPEGEVLEGSSLQSAAVQGALRRALPKSVQWDEHLEEQRGPKRKSPSHSR